MDQARKTEWFEGADWDLFERQYREPYRINLHFFSWLHEQGVLDHNQGKQILYVGAGMGANLYHANSQFPGNSFTGMDLNPECVQKGNDRLADLGASCCKLEVGDLFQMPPRYKNSFGGIFSLALLSWLPDFETPSASMIALNPDWFAATSLFTESRVDATIKTSDYSKPLSQSPCTEKFYNVYSLPRVRDFFAARGYTGFSFKPFSIDIDLPKPEHGGMGTYTERLADGRRIQVSGPVLMSWYFILARKKSSQ
jgi:hypothetical protein